MEQRDAFSAWETTSERSAGVELINRHSSQRKSDLVNNRTGDTPWGISNTHTPRLKRKNRAVRAIVFYREILGKSTVLEMVQKYLYPLYKPNALIMTLDAMAMALHTACNPSLPPSVLLDTHLWLPLATSAVLPLVADCCATLPVVSSPLWTTASPPSSPLSSSSTWPELSDPPPAPLWSSWLALRYRFLPSVDKANH